MYLNTLALGQGHPWLVLSNDKDVAQTGGKGVVNSVLDVNNIETTIVSLAVGDNTNTTHVATTGNHGDSTSVEPDEVGDLSSLKINLDGVVDTNVGVRVTDSAGIVSDEVGNTLLSELDPLDLAQLVGSLGFGDTMDGETTLGVVHETEVLTSLLDRDDVHKAGGEGRVSANLSVDLDQTLHDNCLDLTAPSISTSSRRGREKHKSIPSVKSIFQSVSDENNERHAIPQLVGT